jgi:hypothetical protein
MLLLLLRAGVRVRVGVVAAAAGVWASGVPCSDASQLHPLPFIDALQLQT